MPLDPALSQSDHTVGHDDAPVTLVQYGDFECPYSKDVHDLVRDIRQRHPDGVRFAFRHFPLRPHPNALHAAVASEAAAAQGGFWLLHDRLYQNQLRLRPDQLAAHADAVGLDGSAVRSAIASGAGANAILAQKRAAIRAGVTTTLGLWIDGEWFEEEGLEQAITDHVIDRLRDLENGE